MQLSGHHDADPEQESRGLSSELKEPKEKTEEEPLSAEMPKGVHHVMIPKR